MDITITFDKKTYRLDLAKPLDISIPLRFDGVNQPSVFGAPPAGMEPFTAGDFVGSVQQGGSVNCEIHTIIPHCHGTHTECVGHISQRRIVINDILKDALLPATLITIAPSLSAAGEGYDPPLQAGDAVITRRALESALNNTDPDFLHALIVRTQPNDSGKISRDYDRAAPAFFSREAMQYIAERNIKHLLVDIPSVDRLMDEGKLTNHHTYWGVPHGSHDIDPATCSPKTITELIYIPNTVHDGRYILNLQIAPFAADAAPSRPILYEVKP